uniref:Uncharacterized protein n=1 Tax=Brevundimonas basaltis TaxID=472166 RepID=A0A7W8HZ77_9CAUL|nr:hypothetical protein [Brevundimonas basaltis]
MASRRAAGTGLSKALRAAGRDAVNLFGLIAAQIDPQPCVYFDVLFSFAPCGRFSAFLRLTAVN